MAVKEQGIGIYFGTMAKIIQKISETMHLIGSLILVFCFVYVFVDVVFRFLKLPPIGDVIELCGYLDIWLAYLGIGFLVRQGEHISVDLVTSRVKPETERVFFLIRGVVTLIFTLFMFYKGITMTAHCHRLGFTTLSAGHPIWIFYIPVPIGFFCYFGETLIAFVKKLSGDKKITGYFGEVH